MLVTTLALAIPAHAEERKGGKRKRGKHKIGRMFKQFDKNKDGLLTADEVPERAWQRISKADANGDAAVSRDELRAACRKRRGPKGERRR